MKKSDILILVKSGVLDITNHSLPVESAYKVVKFRKALSSAFDDLGKEEDAISKDAGIDSVGEFNARLEELRKAQKRTDEQQKELEGAEAKLVRFRELQEEMLKQEANIEGVKPMPYADWHKLQDENKDKEINGVKRDLLSGWVEDMLEGVLWVAPEE